MSTHVARTARVRHLCETCDARFILPGERYLRWVSFPSEGLFDSITTMAECAACATRYGRGDLLGAES